MGRRPIAFIRRTSEQVCSSQVAWTLPHNPDVDQSVDADPRWTPGGMWACNHTAVMGARAVARQLANRCARCSCRRARRVPSRARLQVGRLQGGGRSAAVEGSMVISLPGEQ